MKALYPGKSNRHQFRAILASIAMALFAAAAFAADNAKEAEPKVIDPGPPPSDAVVLFDGKDLLQWKNEKGEEPKWKVEDGFMVVNGTGSIMTKEEFAGKRIPPVGAAPDLSKVKYGRAIALFNGENLDGWKLTAPKVVNGWSAQNGLLINRAVQEEGKPHRSYGNLRTEQEFEDFNLKLETRVAQGGNSGVYLRGIYEVQVTDSYGKKLDPHNMGAVYSRITPSVNAEKPAGEWQTLDITLVDRHVTVVLNGTKIIDNAPVMGCTGGALWSDEFRPGPIYLQGDHTGIEYRNIVLKPVVR